jgi:hypothetical protein
MEIKNILFPDPMPKNQLVENNGTSDAFRIPTSMRCAVKTKHKVMHPPHLTPRTCNYPQLPNPSAQKG